MRTGFSKNQLLEIKLLIEAEHTNLLKYYDIYLWNDTKRS